MGIDEMGVDEVGVDEMGSRRSGTTPFTPHYSMVKGCFFIVIRQFNPVDTYRDKFTLHLKTII